MWQLSFVTERREPTTHPEDRPSQMPHGRAHPACAPCCGTWPRTEENRDAHTHTNTRRRAHSDTCLTLSLSLSLFLHLLSESDTHNVCKKKRVTLSFVHGPVPSKKFVVVKREMVFRSSTHGNND